MHGLLTAYSRLDRPECLTAAVRAGVWLRSQQNEDGCWRRSQHNGIAHTYDTRASWAVLRTGLIAQEPALQSTAVRQLDWALKQQDSDGWFAQNAFTSGAAPFTHAIAYAMRGFLESGLLLGHQFGRALHLEEPGPLAALDHHGHDAQRGPVRPLPAKVDGDPLDVIDGEGRDFRPVVLWLRDTRSTQPAVRVEVVGLADARGPFGNRLIVNATTLAGWPAAENGGYYFSVPAGANAI